MQQTDYRWLGLCFGGAHFNLGMQLVWNSLCSCVRVYPLCGGSVDLNRDVLRVALSLRKAPSRPWSVLSLHVLWPEENLKRSSAVPCCLQGGCVGSSCIVCVYHLMAYPVPISGVTTGVWAQGAQVYVGSCAVLATFPSTPCTQLQPAVPKVPFHMPGGS